MTEGELRLVVRENRKAGYKALFQQYHSYVYAIVYNRIRNAGSHEDAEECVSDVFLDVFRQFDQIEEGKLQSYIGTVARHKAIDCFRRLTAKPTAASLDGIDTETAAVETDIEEDYEKAALRQVLLDKIKLLGEPDASIILMKYYYGCSPEEIARTVRMNRPAVRKRLSRAMKRLQTMLTEEGYTMNGGGL